MSLRLRVLLLTGAAILPGVAAILVSGWFLQKDFAALQRAFAQFENVAGSGNADVRSVVVANAYQMTYRMNCFADGVGVLLGALLLAVGVHGLCGLPRASTGDQPTRQKQTP